MFVLQRRLTYPNGQHGPWASESVPVPQVEAELDAAVRSYVAKKFPRYNLIGWNDRSWAYMQRGRLGERIVEFRVVTQTQIVQRSAALFSSTSGDDGVASPVARATTMIANEPQSIRDCFFPKDMARV